jgi:dihydroorotate dehydrogenase
MMHAFRFAGPLLRLLDPEAAHGLTLRALERGFGPRGGQPDDPILAVSLWGRDIPNPIGLAAGFDKNAAAVGPLFGLGFGFLEVGTITPRPQRGNPKPRVFRLPEDGAVINRLGFAGEGAEAAARRLARWRAEGGGEILGVNLGRNRDSADAAADYAAGARTLAAHADYMVINVSSPNTPGLRALQGRAELEQLIEAARAALAEVRPEGAPPLLVKIAPDLEEEDLADIAAVALERGLEGLIATNTTIARPPSLKGRHKAEEGGLSGRPLFAPATRVLAELSRLTGGRVPLVGVGGVASGAEAYAKIRAGASLVQLYTGLIYHGPALVPRIKAELAALLRRDGFAGVGQAVGADVNKKD